MTAGRKKIVCLYLEHSLVKRDEAAYRVTTDDGAHVAIKLSAYQALNDPGKPIGTYFGAERQEQYAAALEKLLDMVAVLTGKRAIGAGQSGPELGIALTHSGKDLVRSYYSADKRLDELGSDWSRVAPILDDLRDPPPRALTDPAVGDDLYALLFGFGSEDCSRELLGRLTGRDQASPLETAVRLRLYSNETSLLRLPWQAAGVGGHRLLDAGWLFELRTTPPSDGPRQPSPCTLHLPARTLVVAGRLERPDHRTLGLCLGNAWGEGDYPAPLEVDSADGLAGDYPAAPLVVYIGPASQKGGRVLLHLRGANGKTKKLPLEEFVAQVASRDSRLLWLHLLSPDPLSLVESIGDCHRYFPLVLAQTARPEDSAALLRSALDACNAVARHGRHPVAAHNRHGLASATAWADCDRFELVVERRPSPVQRDLALLLLDREHQRRALQQSCRDMLRHRKQRLLAAIPYGEPGNRAAGFPRQLFHSLRYDIKDLATARLFKVGAVDGEWSRNGLEEALFSALDYDPEVPAATGSSPLRDALVKLLEEVEPGKHGVLLLAWEAPPWASDTGPRGADPTPDPDRDLKTWTDFCMQRLAPACPDGLRILSLLPLEVHTGLANIEQVVKRARRPYRAGDDQLVPLDPLDLVDEDHVADFLARHADPRCPPELVDDLAVAIYERTGGAFSATVGLLERGLEQGWHTLHAEIGGAAVPA